MSYARQAANYRELEVLSASPEQLVVMLFDHLVLQMTTARIAMEQGDVAKRVTAIGKARAILSELNDTLNFEAGGHIAEQLSSLYVFLLAELTDAGFKRDAAYMVRLTQICATLRDGFVGAAAQLSAPQAPATAAGLARSA
jgi:flagellar protein FliS